MAYQFTGSSSQYLTASAPASGVPMTLAAWLYPQSTAANQAILSVGNSGTAAPYRNALVFLTTGALRAAATTTASALSDTTDVASVNAWCHVAGIFNSLSSRTAFLNGVSGSTNTTTLNTGYNTANALHVGTQPSTSGLTSFLTGTVAEVGVWNVVLTADEIASLSSGFVCNLIRPQSLVFYAPLVRELTDTSGALTISNVNSAVVAAHPRVYLT